MIRPALPVVRPPRRAALLVAVPLIAAAAALGAAPAGAQQVVGYPPARSPYRDVESSQRVSLFGGYFRPQNDEIGATPRGGPILGLRYEIPVGGPAAFTVRGAYIDSHRTAYDPTLAAGARGLGDMRQSLFLADLGFALNVTGQKSWHSIIPTVAFGLGVITGPTTAAKDPYRFGTQFAISSAVGVRIVPSSSFELRVEAGSLLYQNRYPTPYFTSTTIGVAPLLGSGTAKSGYRNAWTLTAGIAVPVFR